MEERGPESPQLEGIVESCSYIPVKILGMGVLEIVPCNDAAYYRPIGAGFMSAE